MGLIGRGFLAFADDEPVNHDFNGMLLLLVQVDFVADVMNCAIYAHTHIAGTAHVFEDTLIFALTSLNQRRQQHDARTFGQVKYRVYNLLDGLLAHLSPAIWAVRMT